MANITSWTVADFKSLGEASLKLPHLTVLAGANSSGKSSALQSILMMAQSVTRGGRLVMNGPLVRLGEPSDVVREGQSAIELRFDVLLDPSPADDEVAPPVISVTVSLAPSADGTTLQPSSFEVWDQDGVLVIAATSERTKQVDVDALSERMHNADVSFLRVRSLDGKRAPNRMYLGFLGITPALLARHVDPRVIQRQMTSALEAALNTTRVTYDVIQELSQLVPRAEFNRETETNDERSSGEHQRQRISAMWTAREISSLTQEQRAELVEKAALARSENDWVAVALGIGYLGFYQRPGRRYYPDGGVMEAASADDHASAVVALSSFASAIEDFGLRIRYLGPLREEPRVVQGAWDERVHSLPVGIRGELTAEILTSQKDREISFRDWDGADRVMALPDAAALWCDYFGIGDKIEVLDLGKLGRGVEVRVDGVNRDLTMIGVGASQLLPILVASLAASPGSTVLIEQPELHLHPTVQSRLADFFLFAKPDVRFIVETHSEYLITRIRRRIAEERSRPEEVDVMFAERISGATNVRSLALSDGGDFDEWPEGFFDSQEIDTRYIIRAVAARLAGNKG